MKLRGLNAITPEGLGTEALVAAARRALDGAAAVLQYRNKLAAAEPRREQAQAPLALARRKGVPLIVAELFGAPDIGSRAAEFAGLYAYSPAISP